MKIILEKETKEQRADYRDDLCVYCDDECNPHYRFTYWSEEDDEKGKNPIITGEISSCGKCYPKVLKMFPHQR